jgi:hypothetical protein
MTRSTALALLALLSLTACFGTETGNPPFAPSVGGEAGVPMGIVPRLSVDRGWLSIANVALEGCADEESTVVRTEPAALALSETQALPTEPVLEEGDYCAFGFDLAAYPDASPAELSGSTFALDASLSDGTPIHIRGSLARAVRLTGLPFAMSAESGALIVFVDESLLFNAVSFDAAERQADRSILVSPERNSALLDHIEAQLPGAIQLYRDADDDGLLSSEERSAGALATFEP